MKIIAISDFHGILPEIEECDLLLICGDISPFDIQFHVSKMQSWLSKEFKNWIDSIPTNKIIMTPGNHDAYFEMINTDKKRRSFENQYNGKLICLWNEYREVSVGDRVLKVFGTPYCHVFGMWPFMKPPITLKEKFSQIPANLDILLTHDPVFALGDSDVILKPKYQNQAHYDHVGNVELRDHLISLNDNCSGLPKYCFCGHIHSGDHKVKEYLGMKYANVSLMDEFCTELIYKPLIIEYANT